MNRAVCLVLAAAAPAAAQPSCTETFDGGINAGNWTIIGGPGGSIQTSGGNPGPYFGGTSFNYPDFQASGPSPFTGDYRTRTTARLQADFITFSHQGAIFPLTLLLVSDNGTPSEPSDDWGAYTTGPDLVPNTGQGWRSFSFQLEPLSGALPAGWTWYDAGPPGTHDWSTLMANVSEVHFLFAPPGTISNYPVWNVGGDNFAILAVAIDCYANCDGSNTPPTLNVNDFICFQAAFATGNSYANCDHSTAPPVLNVNDFICFMSAFAACSAP